MHLRRLRLGLFVVALIAPIVAGFIIAHSLKQTPTLVQTFRERQYEAALHQQETLLPGLRGQRMVRQQFDRLAESMPPPDHANLGPHISTVAWRTSPWAVTMVLRRHDGALFPVLAYGAGAGVNYQQYAKLVGSRIFPITFTQWQTIRRENPAGLIDQNHSPNSCRDTRRAKSPYAVIGTGATLARIAKAELQRATRGISILPGTSFVCYHVDDTDFLEFGAGGGGVLFRIVNDALVPASRGYIELIDARGGVLVVHVRSTEDKGEQRIPVNEYLVAQWEVTPRSR